MTADARSELRAIFEGALAAIDAFSCVERSVHCARQRLRIGELPEIDLAEFSRVVVLGAGKAAVPMADALVQILPDSPEVSGCVVTSDADAADDRVRRFEVLVGEHPTPSAGSFAAGRRLLDLAWAADRPDTLVLFVISGGASALAESPRGKLSTADLSSLYAELVGCGATIAEINTVRRVLSGIKDGRLAAAADRAKQVSLLLSDVNPGDLSALGSGPTVAPLEDALEAGVAVLRRYSIAGAKVASIRARFEGRHVRRDSGRVYDSVVVGDNSMAVSAAVRVARQRGHDAMADSSIGPEPRVDVLAQWLVSPFGRGLRVAGGEALCPVQGGGRGGRNLEAVLRAAIELDQTRVPIAVLSAGTDGIDGNSPVAGAVADRSTVSRALALGLDPITSLHNSNAFPLFDALGDTIVTGPTGTNVRDLYLGLEGPRD